MKELATKIIGEYAKPKPYTDYIALAELGKQLAEMVIESSSHSSDLCDECKCLLEDGCADHCSMNPNNWDWDQEPTWRK